jgi:hypothetical protein
MKTWTWVRTNIDIVVTIFAALIILLLSFFQQLDQEVIAEAILAILVLIAINLLINRNATTRLRQVTEGILANQQAPSLDQAIIPYGEWMDEIQTSFASADEVWILSRTCIRLWVDYADDLKKVLRRNGSVRLMLVDPADGALAMIAGSADFDSPDDPELLRNQVRDFLRRMAELKDTHKGLAVRTINYLPPWTLVMVNPNSDDSSLFVELATYRANGRNRPTFWLFRGRDSRLFGTFYNEFETMWKWSQENDHQTVAG